MTYKIEEAKLQSHMKENRILVFETHVGEGGHHLEYLNHLYKRAVDISDTSFVFVVPEQFEKTKVRFEWPQCSNVTFDYIDDNRVGQLRQFCGIKYCYFISKLAKFYFEKHKANEVFLISLINFVMFLPFMLSRNAKISGILYYVYLYDWAKLGWKKKIEQILMFLVMTRRKNFGKLYVLNDNSAVAYLNKLYKTNRFFYIPDPVASCDLPNYSDSTLLDLPQDAKVYLQCGMMSGRKMTLQILEMITTLPEEEKMYFLFTGKIQNDIKEEFYHFYPLAKEKHNIYVKDCHLSYEEMAYFLNISDCVFILYDNTAQSSGFLGHAALHRKPVIAYNKGMIGKLVRKYHLGYTISFGGVESLSHDIQKIANIKYKVSDLYIKTHRVSDFTSTLFE